MVPNMNKLFFEKEKYRPFLYVWISVVFYLLELMYALSIKSYIRPNLLLRQQTEVTDKLLHSFSFGVEMLWPDQK